MHVFKWHLMHTRMFFAPEDGGGSASPSPVPSGGDAGGAVTSSSPVGDSGGGSTPAPSPTPDSSPDATSAPSENLWDALGEAGDLDYVEVPPAPPTPPAGVQPAAPVAPTAPAATPPVQPTAAQPQADAQPASPTQPQPEPSAAAAALSPSDPMSVAGALEANRDAVIAHLAQSKFALTEDDIRELETDVVAAVPKLLSRVFLEAQVSMQKFLAQSVPGMVKQYNTVTKANTDAQTKFFESNKHLGLDMNNPKHNKVAFRLASIYRQANPTIPLEQLISDVGPMVAMSLKLAPPAAPVPGSPMTIPRSATPFRPAVGGGGSSPAPAEESPWAGMAQTFDD